MSEDAGQGSAKWKSRTFKVLGIVGAAFVASLGGYLADRMTSGVEKQMAGEALAVKVLTEAGFVSAHVYAPYYVIPAAAGLDPAQAPDFFEPGWGAWALARQGVPGSPQIVRLELRGKTDEPVVINGLRVRALRRDRPVQGWYMVSPGCGAETVRTAYINLDAQPAAIEFRESDDPEAPLVKRLTLSVNRHDVEILELHASTEDAYVEWVAEILYSSADGSGVLEVNDGGKPFRITTERASAGYVPEDTGPVHQKEWDGTGISAC